MKILTETRDLLIVEDSTSKNAFRTYVILMMLINIIIIIYIKIMLGIFPLWLFLVLIIVDIIMIPSRSRVKVSVDKKNNSLRVFENKREHYVSDYPLTEIKSIKRVLTYHYPLVITYYNRTSLIAVLKNVIE
jgi:hypothetical protein